MIALGRFCQGLGNFLDRWIFNFWWIIFNADLLLNVCVAESHGDIVVVAWTWVFKVRFWFILKKTEDYFLWGTDATKLVNAYKTRASTAQNDGHVSNITTYKMTTTCARKQLYCWSQLNVITIFLCHQKRFEIKFKLSFL